MPLYPAHVELPSDELLLIEATSDFARTELLLLDRAWDRGESSVTDVLPKLAEMGLLAPTLPEEVGGLNCSMRLYACILHEISKWSPSTCVTLSVHSMVAKVLSKRLNEPRWQSWLSEFCQPENLAAFALSEAGAGSDAAAVSTTATRVDGGFRVSGEKMWITNGLNARWFLTLVRLEGLDAERNHCAMLIDGWQAGFERSKIDGKMGIRGSDTAVIHMDNVFVPQAAMIGEPGEGLAVFLSTLNEGRIAIAAQATGIAEACLEEMVGYTQQREQFGQTIGRFQAVANMVADSAVELDAARALVWRAAGLVDADRADKRASSMAKLFASESANRIAYRAVQVHGGTGYVRESRVEQLYRDARITTIYEGTSEVQRILIGKSLGQQFDSLSAPPATSAGRIGPAPIAPS